jgi:hypothetical protein
MSAEEAFTRRSIVRTGIINRSAVAVMLSAMLAIAAWPVSGHHGTAASYDQETWVTVTGVVTEFRWRNPHSSLHLDVKDESGKVVNYAIELASPALMSRQGTGWTRRTFKTGDTITFRVHPSKTGAAVGECLFNCEVTINGTKLVNANAGGRQGAPTPAQGEGR